MALPDTLNDRQHQSFIDAGTGTTAVRVSSPMASSLATINIGSAETTGTTASDISGMIYKVTQGLGTLSGTPGTVDTVLVDALGGTIAVLAAQAESSTVSYSTIVPVTTGMSWVTTATGDPDGTQTAAAGVNVVLNITYQQ